MIGTERYCAIHKKRRATTTVGGVECCATCARVARESDPARRSRFVRRSPDYTELAERELGLDFRTCGRDNRERIIERTHALVSAAKAAGTFRDPNKRGAA